MARQAGATTSTAAKADIAWRRGAAATFLYHNGGFADRVREATGGRGVDVVFDPLSKPTLRDSMRATRKKGVVMAFGSVGGNFEDLNSIELGEAGSLSLPRPRFADHLRDAATIRRRAADIFRSTVGRGPVPRRVRPIHDAHGGTGARGARAMPQRRQALMRIESNSSS